MPNKQYSEKESTFLFDFEWQNHYWCIDASTEDGSLGRLVNDNQKSPNCTMKKIVNDEPHLCLFAIKNIEMGTEIDYNYGDSKWPWREKVTGSQAPVDGALPEPDRTWQDSGPDYNIKQDASQQVTGSQAPVDGALPEPARTWQDSDPDDNIKQDASQQVTGSQAPVDGALPELARTWQDSDPDDNIKQDASQQVTGSQAPVDGALPEPARTWQDSDPDDNIKQDASQQVTGSQAPVDGALPEPARTWQDSDPDDNIKQDASQQSYQLSKEFLKVDYSDSDDTDNDSQKDRSKQEYIKFDQAFLYRWADPRSDRSDLLYLRISWPK
nr:uncharacterized protein LOC125976693 isoform X16 [Syngnathus scovelli]